MMNRDISRFKDLLKAQGHSLTAPRMQLFNLLYSQKALAINEIVDCLPYNRSTIYRTLGLFQKLGVVVEIHLGLKHKYELSDIFLHHHHHLSCINCDAVYPVPEDIQLEQSITRLSCQKGFTPIDHQLEIRGICKQCQKQGPQVNNPGSMEASHFPSLS